MTIKRIIKWYKSVLKTNMVEEASREFRLRKNLLDYTNLFSPNDYKKDDEMIYKCFNDKNGRGSKSCV